MPPVRDGTERPLRHGLLSYAQEGLWLVSQFDPSGAYNNILVIRFQGRLNILTLEQSVNEIVRRHESLRTRFRLINGTPHQIVEPDGHVDLHIVDLRGDTDPKLEQALARAAEVGREPFDLGRSAMRCLVLRLSAEDHLLVVSLHHIVSDGTSVTIFMRELVMLYSAFVRGEPSPLEDLPAQYLDFVALQRERLSPDRLVAGIEFWKRQLAGAPAVLDLPCDRPRPPAQTFRGGIRSIQLSEGLTQGLRSLVRQNKATLYMAFLAAWQLLLYRYTGQEDLVVGTPMTLRRRKEFQPVMGYFANALALRAAITGDMTFTQLLRSVRDTALAAYQHSDIPFDKVVQALRPPRARSHHPIFQVLLAFNERGAGQLEASHFTISDLEVSFPQFDAGTSRFDLTLCVHEGIESLVLDLEYSSDLFEAATIEAMAGHLCLLLEAMIADPNLTVARVPLLTDWERHRQLVEWNDTRVAHPTGGLVHELFEEQVRREPHAVALVHEDRRWTYGDLNTEANRLAWRLRSLGVGPETFVGLHVQRGFEMVAGLLGVLKAGGAYIGLDPNDGEDRARFIIDDLGVRAILTEARLAAALPRTAATVLPIESSSGRTVESPSVADPPRLGSDRHLAYAIYTSGSTGTPKAVGIEHASAVSFLHWAGRAFGRDGLSGVLATTAPTFDCTLFEVLAPLSWGGTVVLANSVLDLPVTSGVKLVHTVPSAIAGLLESGGIPSSVETLALTGEALPGALLSDIFRLTGIRRVFNFYGASEATTFTTRGTFTTAEVKGLVGEEGENAEPPTPTIGRPIDNVRTYVLDRSLNLVPRGVIGELCIGGAGVARGYINRLALTDERFIADPFSAEPGARLYRTGDLARYRANGDLEFLGRIDRQVKVRGFRIELGEVEFALERHPAVRQAAVIVREEQPGGDRHLVAYVVPQEPPGTAPSELRAHLAHNLPAFMVPSRFVSLDRLPLTSSGKVDRRALPAPERPRTSTSEEWQPPDYVAAELANIWRTLLDVDSVNPEDDFFDLGGHSILALGAVWRIREAFGVDIPLEAFFDSPTFEALADLIRRGSAAPLPPLVKLADGDSRRPLFCVHSSPGDLMFLRILLRHVQFGRPVYGFRSVGLDRRDEPLPTISDMAIRYLEELRTVQPAGPYLLAGNCIGGLIAVEMAHRLVAAGERVAFLGLMDTTICERSTDAKDRVHEADLAGMRLATLQDQLGELGVRRLPEGSEGSSTEVPEFVQWLSEVSAKNACAALAYEVRPYPGPITLFTATLGPLDPEELEEEWRSVAEGGLSVIPIEAEHDDIGESPVLGQCLKECLDQVDPLASRPDPGSASD